MNFSTGKIVCSCFVGTNTDKNIMVTFVAFTSQGRPQLPLYANYLRQKQAHVFSN